MMTNSFCVVGTISILKDNTIFIDVVFDISTKDTITLPVVMTEGLADKVPGLLHVGDMIGVKGSFGKTVNNKPVLHADKLSVLRSTSQGVGGVYSA